MGMWANVGATVSSLGASVAAASSQMPGAIERTGKTASEYMDVLDLYAIDLKASTMLDMVKEHGSLEELEASVMLANRLLGK